MCVYVCVGVYIYMCVCVCVCIHFPIQQKLAQHCKLTKFQ